MVAEVDSYHSSDYVALPLHSLVLLLSRDYFLTEGSVNSSIEAPQVTIFTNKKHNGHSHIAVILGAVGGVILALFIISLSVFLYRKRKDSEVTYSERTDMRDWKIAKSYSYKEIKAATNNFKEIIGRGSFGSIFVGKLPDGIQVAVKVRYDRTQLGVDSFINEATIMKPAVMVGTEDRILNPWAHYVKKYGFLPLFGDGSTKIQPVYVVDVASAIVAALKVDGTSMGKVYELVRELQERCQQQDEGLEYKATRSGNLATVEVYIDGIQVGTAQNQQKKMAQKLA